MNTFNICTILLSVALVSCGHTQSYSSPLLMQTNDKLESEYLPFLSGGDASLSGQAFLTQRGGGVVKAAGRTVTLDPATTIGNDWWYRAGVSWKLKDTSSTSPNFVKSRRSVIADADGKFGFQGLAAGEYYIRTEVTWTVGNYDVQGGLLGKKITVAKGKNEIILAEIVH